jgi:uncharacterized OB-fold protein
MAMQQKKLSVQALIELSKKHDIPLEDLLPTVQRELADVIDTGEILRVPYRIGTTLYRSMAHLSRFFREIRDNGIFYAGKCPVCGHRAFPPQHAACHVCIKKGILSEYKYIELGPKVEGTVLSWCRLVRGGSKHVGKGEVYPCVVKVDGSDIALIQFVLPREGAQIRVGARVESVLVPQENRTGEVTDFAFVLI